MSITNATFTSSDWAHFKYPASLSPLPTDYKPGIIILILTSLLSCITTLGLAGFLIYRFVTTRNDYRTPLYKNQYMILILSLVIADFQCSLGFLLDIVWLCIGKVIAPSSTCVAQAWFINVGDLASGFFVFAIALHTFATVVYGFRVGLQTIWICSGILWFLSVLLTLIPVILHPKNIFVFQGNWCSINGKYDILRLYFHYIWIFIAEGLVLVCYAITFIVLRKRLRGIGPILNQQQSITTGGGNNSGANDQNLKAKQMSRATMYMILYPLIYVVTTLPLAAGRISNMVNKPAPRNYLLIGGVIMSCGGWLNCLLYSLTRRIFIISGNTPQATVQDKPRSRYGGGTIVNGGIELKSNKFRELPSPTASTDNIVHVGSQKPGYDSSVETKSNNEGVMIGTTWEVKTESIRRSPAPETPLSGEGRLGYHTYVSH